MYRHPVKLVTLTGTGRQRDRMEHTYWESQCLQRSSAQQKDLTSFTGSGFDHTRCPVAQPVGPIPEQLLHASCSDNWHQSHQPLAWVTACCDSLGWAHSWCTPLQAAMCSAVWATPLQQQQPLRFCRHQGNTSGTQPRSGADRTVRAILWRLSLILTQLLLFRVLCSISLYSFLCGRKAKHLWLY